MFQWSTDKCFDENIPDSPARAFRSLNGQVNLYATHFKNSPLVGPSLNEVHSECAVKFEAKMNAVPEMYNARIWLQTFYSPDGGKKIYSLGSSDYHGNWFKNCGEKNRENQGCWWSAIVLAHSEDGGKTFNSAPPPHHIVAQSPYKFSKDSKGPIGFLTTSNIVKIDDYYYSIFNVAGFKEQSAGNCIARSNDLSDPGAWRFWNGKDYNQSFNSSKQENNAEGGFSCTTLKGFPYKVRSLLWHTSSQRYIAVFEENKVIKGDEPRVDVKFSYSWSDNLIDWHVPKEIMTLPGKKSCKSQAMGAYPAILDSNSNDVNFGTVGNDAYLYYTRFNVKEGCKLTLDRDLVRVPITINLDKE